MAISYPISIPTTPTVSEVRWIAEHSQFVDESPFSFARQVQVFSGERWKIEVSVDKMTREEAAAWTAFIASLRGAVGSFTFGDELYKNPRGAGGGTPKVNGAGQSGYTLITDGWPNNTLVLKAGDFFQVSGTYGIHEVLTNATSNGSGQVTLDIWPKARSYSDNSDIIYSGWKGLFALEDTEIEILSPRYDQYQTINFSAVEIR
jgi:hypothetical protein